VSNRRRLRDVSAPVSMPARPLGFEPKLNAYRCDDCGGNTVTLDVDEGVTPMFLGCRADGTETGCGGRAVSMGYPKGPAPSWAVPAWEWYKPGPVELRGMSPEMRDHCQRGGLALRRIGDPPASREKVADV
jgi:hypothetical protein